MQFSRRDIGPWLNMKALRVLDQKYVAEAIKVSSLAEFSRVRASAWLIPNSFQWTCLLADTRLYHAGQLFSNEGQDLKVFFQWFRLGLPILYEILLVSAMMSSVGSRSLIGPRKTDVRGLSRESQPNLKGATDAKKKTNWEEENRSAAQEKGFGR